MQVDLRDRLTYRIDSAAEPVDQDAALARFLLDYVRRIDAGSTSPAEVRLSSSEVTKKVGQ